MTSAADSTGRAGSCEFREAYYQRVRQVFDKVASGYDCSELRFFKHGADLLSKMVPLKGDERVLDVGTGTGEVALALARQLKSGRVTAIDVSAEMIKRAEEKARLQGGDNIAFIQGDMCELHPRARLYDGVFSGFAATLFPDFTRCIEALAGLALPGGFVAISSFTPATFEPQITRAFEDAECAGAKIPSRNERKRYLTEGEHRMAFQVNGLSDIFSKTEQLGYDIENVNRWWHFLANSGFRGGLMGMSPDQLKSFKNRHLRQMGRMYGGSGFNLNIEARFTLGWKR